MEEIWKNINGYEGLYQVSNLGRVRSLDRYRKGKANSDTFCKGREIKHRASNGYRIINLCKNGKYEFKLIHRLVAEAFIPNPNNFPCVDHINGVRSDNNKDNLRWCTYKENLSFELARNNIRKAQKNSIRYQKHLESLHENCMKKVVIVFRDGTVKRYKSATETEIDGFCHSHVIACCRGKLKTHKKCKCYYEEDYEVLFAKLPNGSCK